MARAKSSKPINSKPKRSRKPKTSGPRGAPTSRKVKVRSPFQVLASQAAQSVEYPGDVYYALRDLAEELGDYSVDSPERRAALSQGAILGALNATHPPGAFGTALAAALAGRRGPGRVFKLASTFSLQNPSPREIEWFSLFLYQLPQSPFLLPDFLYGLVPADAFPAFVEAYATEAHKEFSALSKARALHKKIRGSGPSRSAPPSSRRTRQGARSSRKVSARRSGY